MYFLNKREYLYYESQDVIASRVTIHENVTSAFAAEAHACLEAVRLGLEMKEHRIYVEGDLISVDVTASRGSSSQRNILSRPHRNDQYSALRHGMATWSHRDNKR
ncbi:hypothetical protein Golob_000393 [Gossypium lobatum]|uniref:RNase H type-1 domain-containing protein n=1 Tax=Gossypium lobatum TaxID=34289 RepID=A0A7J8N8E3_9ROSI|nr:hypothetical protein [Gossypium lobatum]